MRRGRNKARTGLLSPGIGLAARREMAATLRASEAMLDRAGRLAGVGGWEIDLAKAKVHWSRQTYQIHDKTPGAPIPLEEGLSFYGDDGQRQLREAVARAQEHGQPWDLELPLMTALGRFLWVRVVGEALPPARPGGPIERLVGSVQDVTERRALEEATRRANTVLQSVIDNLPCGLSVYDSELVLTAHNAQFRRLLELPDALFAGPAPRFPDIVQFGLQIGEYGQGPKAQAVANAYLAYAQHPKARTFERTRPNGMTLEVRAAPMPGGGFITTYVDLSERQRAQAEIERREQLLRGAIDAVDEAFVLFDSEDRLVFCNEKYRSVYANVADLLQPGVSFEQLVRARAERGSHAEATGRIDEWVAERLAMHRAGDTRMVQRLDDGRWLRVIERRMADGHTAGFRIDITDLMRASEAAEKASVAKGQFLANMSHEIRTPMNAVLGMLRLLQKTPLTPRQQDYAAKTEGAARSLLGLLNDILDFSKVEAGKMSLDPQPMRIDELLRQLAVILGANLGRKPIELLFDVDPRLPRCVLADAMRLQQVLINLAGNAIKFTEAGEVVLRLKVIELADERVSLEVSVSDTGIGIAREHQAQIFNGFSQAEASTSRRFGGTGLGLAISQRLVQLMGADLQLDSAPGRGSRFFFQLQLDLPAQQPAASFDGAALRALLVDDNASARELLASMGESLGWRVDTAESGESALRCVAAASAAGDPYQVVLVDWAMPGLDGWQTSQRLRAQSAPGRDRSVPVLVMVTAHGREMLAQRSERDQGLLDGFLVKPVTASMLYDAVIDARAGAGLEGPAPTPVLVGPTARRLTGLRLLVVEDNMNNQQVACELLEDEGAVVLLASDGQQALSLLALAKQGGPIDAVLMDVQMPVMDGCTATRLIRRQLGLSLPVVAMTANAMAADRQACLDAGMNDYVGKPFDVDHLVAVLLRQCGVAPRHMRARPRPLLAPALLDQAQRAGIDLEDAVSRLSGKHELFGRMVGALTQTAEQLPAQLDGVDGAAGAAALHGFRGLAATLGARALAEQAGQGERLLQGGEPLPAGWRGRFDELLRRDLAALAELARQLPATAAPVPADVVLQPALRALVDLLDGSDLAALAAFAQLRSTLFKAHPVVTTALDAELAALDFSSAAQRCRALLEPAA